MKVIIYNRAINNMQMMKLKFSIKTLTLCIITPFKMLKQANFLIQLLITNILALNISKKLKTNELHHQPLPVTPQSKLDSAPLMTFLGLHKLNSYFEI